MQAICPTPHVGPEDKRRVLDSVIQSRTFSRSDQLKRFLRYVCEKDIAGKTDEISEYSIAIEALGRSTSYSSAYDSSVRTRAHALRQKLQEYYESEDPDADLRIEMAKGAYCPQFFRRPPVALSMPATAADPAAQSAESPTRPPLRLTSGGGAVKPFLAGVFAAALLITIPLFLLSSHRQGTRIDPILHEAWRQMVNPGDAVDVYIASPPAMLLHSYKDDRLPTFPVPLLPAPKEVAAWYDGLQMKDGGGRLYAHVTQDVFLFGDSLAATSATKLLSAVGARPKLMPEANSQAFALRGRDVILIGSPNYSPLAARFLRHAPFSVRYDPATREEVVSDNPPAGKPKQVFRPSSDEFGMLTNAYGLITVLPSQETDEGGTQMLIFSGITSAGPQGALEFFRSPDDLRVLKAKLKQQGYATFPRAYQVVVRCSLDHNLALTWEYAAHRVIQHSPLLP